MHRLEKSSDPREKWMKKHLYHGGYYEPKWYIVPGLIENTYCFQDEKEYLHFLLVWE